MMNRGNVSTASARRALFAVIAAAMVAIAAVLAFSSPWAPSAHAAQGGELKAAGLQAAGSATYAQTELGFQVIPVTLKAGAVKLNFASGASSGSVGIYAKADAEGNTSGSIATVYTSDPYATGSRYGNVAKSGTYYLQFYTSKYSGSIGSTATITSYPYVKAKTAKLNGSTLGTGCGNNATVAYYKITVKKRGYLTLKVEDATGWGSGATVSLRNARKASLIGSYAPYTSADKPIYFGVKPGTYYLAVKSYASLYRVKPKFTAVTRPVTANKARAVAIPRGKKVSAVMAAGEKTAWYKFKVTKKKNYTFTLSGKLHDSLRMTFSGSGYYEASSYLSMGSAVRSFKTNTLKPGTYYIKVARTGKGNGLYTISWK